jgi:sugar lactone lactonase YvrE
MPLHRIRRYAEGRASTAWEEPGCGPTSIKPDGRGGFWILCHLGHRVLRLDSGFNLVKRLEIDGAGNALSWPNDATVDRRGRLYFTSSGIFDLRAPAEGAVYFVDLQDRVRRIAGGLRYANGVHLDEKRHRLYVSEHLQRRVLAAEVSAPGKIGPLRAFFDLNVPALRRPAFAQAGPDGLLANRDGSLYVAEYGAGRVLLVSPQGALQRVIPVPTPFVTNFAYWAERGEVIVTGTFSLGERSMPGRVFTLPK